MTDTFIWVPLLSSPGGQTTDRTKFIQFGDGYEQEAPDGINTETSTWQLTFIDKADVITAIRDFLRAHQGATPFYWTPPLDVPLLFKCKSRTPPTPLGAGNYTLTATFTQTFAP